MTMCGECPPKGHEARNRVGGPVCIKEPHHNWNGVGNPHSWEQDGRATLTNLLLRLIYDMEREAPE